MVLSAQPDQRAITGRLTTLLVVLLSSTLIRRLLVRRREGKLISDFDLLIAATASTYDLTLVTNNLNHFRRIPNLRLETWVPTI